MAKANPKAYFPGCIAQISYRKVDAWARRQEKYKPFFETWAEAHAHMLEKAKEDLKRKERDCLLAKRHLAKVQAMTNKAEASNG